MGSWAGEPGPRGKEPGDGLLGAGLGSRAPGGGGWLCGFEVGPGACHTFIRARTGAISSASCPGTGGHHVPC